MGVNLTLKGKTDNHHLLSLQEGTTLLWILLQVCYLWVGKSFASQSSEEAYLRDKADLEEESVGEILWSLPSW